MDKTTTAARIQQEVGKLQSILKRPEFAQLPKDEQDFFGKKIGEVENILRGAEMPDFGKDTSHLNNAKEKLINLQNQINEYYSNR